MVCSDVYVTAGNTTWLGGSKLFYIRARFKAPFLWENKKVCDGSSPSSPTGGHPARCLCTFRENVHRNHRGETCRNQLFFPSFAQFSTSLLSGLSVRRALSSAQGSVSSYLGILSWVKKKNSQRMCRARRGIGRGDVDQLLELKRQVVPHIRQFFNLNNEVSI